MKKLSSVLLFTVLFFMGSYYAKAEVIKVDTAQQLQDEITNAVSEKEIELSEKFPKNEAISLNIEHENPLNIKGGSQKFKNKFTIKVKEETNLIFDGFDFDGEGNKNVGMHFLFENNYYFDSSMKIINSNFSNSNDTPLKAETPGHYLINQVVIQMDNLNFKNNVTKDGGALILDAQGGVNLTNSTFENNRSNSEKYGGAAISFINSEHVTIENSVFKNNELVKEGLSTDLMGGGAIGMYHDEVSLSNMAWTLIRGSIFESNKAVKSANQSGGAIYIRRDLEYSESLHDLRIIQTTFKHNESSNAGGAVALVEPNLLFDMQMTNYWFDRNLYYENSVNSKTTTKGGGAIYVNSIIAPGKNEKYYNTQYIVASTYYKNSVNLNGKPQNSGAVKVDGFEQLVLMNNSVFGLNSGSTNSDQVQMINGEITLDYNRGLNENETSDKIFGKYDVLLNENEGRILAGSKGNKHVIPSISVLPRFTNNKNEVISGIASEYEKVSTRNDDIRGYNEMPYLSAGAVENTSIVYDASGGTFKLPQLTHFDNKKYYEGENPTQYADNYYRNSTQKIKNGLKDLNITRKGYKFIGWSEKPNQHFADGNVAAGKSVELKMQKKLYAVWQKDLKRIKYFGNSKTTGTVPKASSMFAHEAHTIKKQGTMKRKGYKFIGWSTKPNAIKGEVKYAPGKKVTTSKEIKLYAIWKKTK